MRKFQVEMIEFFNLKMEVIVTKKVNDSRISFGMSSNVEGDIKALWKQMIVYLEKEIQHLREV